MRILTLAFGLVAVVTTASPSHAQSFNAVPRAVAAAPATPPTTLMAPYVSSRGVTKPPGAALGSGVGKGGRLERRSQELDQGIRRDLCSGCF